MLRHKHPEKNKKRYKRVPKFFLKTHSPSSRIVVTAGCNQNKHFQFSLFSFRGCFSRELKVVSTRALFWACLQLITPNSSGKIITTLQIGFLCCFAQNLFYFICTKIALGFIKKPFFLFHAWLEFIIADINRT